MHRKAVEGYGKDKDLVEWRNTNEGEKKTSDLVENDE